MYWRNLFAIALLAPGLSAAADQAMLELIMPDARAVMEVNLGRVFSSPFGQAMSNEVKNQLADFRPGWQNSAESFAGMQWEHYAQEVIFASGTPPAPGRPAPSLMIVRGMIDPVWIESLNAFSGTKTSYMGVPILAPGRAAFAAGASSGATPVPPAGGGAPAVPAAPAAPSGGGAVVAFLDGSIAVMGLPSEVKAAIRRRGQNTPPSPVLAEGLARYEGQYDIWMVSAGAVGAPARSQFGPSMQWLNRTESFTGGLRVSPDLDLSVNIAMREEKDVAEITNALQWFASVIQTQERTALTLDDLNYRADGKRVSFSLQIPEEQLRVALQQRALPARPTRAIRPQEISSGLPQPPAGSIRVQSSPADMGTVVLPLAKSE